MDERLEFVARSLDGETMTAVCREFGISRKAGYKIFSLAGVGSPEFPGASDVERCVTDAAERQEPELDIPAELARREARLATIQAARQLS